ncbi:type I phosphomannose isomerase catalytic subunit [Limibacterium fermenti]|uniref:type I phosphomannose isomerase catalytic subunit n=1 Tax=Limibacterium fermenti TaxID=3229863 RepID=UPI000E8EE532|nr:mannose-6-phosphate isomerase [Porphyromonadaceae bacterium]
MNLYPFKFKPILKPVIWGGSDICKFKHLEPQDGIGESWEVSGVKNNVSVVADGPLEGQSLDELLAGNTTRLVGKKVYDKFGKTFPLLIKFIDARDDLSIQVHPNDELSAKRHGSFGKTEMWYVVNATPDAFLYTGFAKPMNPELYVEKVKDNTFTDSLKKYSVQPGDVFFLPAGRVHAIGAGCFVAEIQQTSDITYRIYDYNRKDAQGNTRELHIDLAKDAIDYGMHDSYKTDYTPEQNRPVELVSCPYFTTSLLELNAPLSQDYSNLDSFIIYIGIEGSGHITDHKGNKVSIRQGESVLIPADTQNIDIHPQGALKLLETFIK